MRKVTRKCLIFALAMILMTSVLPIGAMAAGHVHDASCGYAPASPCGHVHDGCYEPPVPGVPCNKGCVGEHSADCAYIEAHPGLPCDHVHDAACGYSAGSPCTWQPSQHSHLYYYWNTNESTHYSSCTCGEQIYGEHTDNNRNGRCDSCGYELSDVKSIPATGFVPVRIEDDANVKEVTFITAEGIELPEDAEVIVVDHTPSADDLDFLLGINADTEYLDLDDEQISMYEIEWFSITYEGVTYKMGEYIIIDGLVYFISGVISYSHSLHLIRTDNKSDYILELGSDNLINNRDERQFDVPTNKKVSINGITYDVKCIFNTSGVNDEEMVQWMLYYGGEPVGTYFPGLSKAVFHEGYDPETLKAQQNVNDLGTVTTSENPIDGLVSGKTYNVSVIGSNDISVPGFDTAQMLLVTMGFDADSQGYSPGALAELAASTQLKIGTLTQTFDLPAQYVNNPNVKFVAVHNTDSFPVPGSWSSLREEIADFIEEWHKQWEKTYSPEIGTVEVSEDGQTLTAIYLVNNFSPFTVYAFVEAEPQEYKELSASIVDGSDT